MKGQCFSFAGLTAFSAAVALLSSNAVLAVNLPEEPSMDADFTFYVRELQMGSYSFSDCLEEYVGDGECDQANNIEDCGYDGGDCCECTCVSSPFKTCGENGFQCYDPSSSCVDEYVDAGTVTTVSAAVSAYDARPGGAGNDIGCGLEGCSPSLARDGVINDPESRWSCAKTIVPGGGQCEIDFTFETPQDIKGFDVAFWKYAERTRTLKVRLNGVVIGEFDSDPESMFTSIDVDMDQAQTVTFESIGIGRSDWISILEVRFLVEP